MRLMLLAVLLILSPAWARAQSTQPALDTTEGSSWNPDGVIDLPVGDPVMGEITESHPVVETERIQEFRAEVHGQTYRIVLMEPGTYHVDLRSYYFDGYLVLRTPAGEVLLEDDDSLLGRHARLVFDSKGKGEVYLLDACSLHGEFGTFDLRLVQGSPKELTGERLRAAILVDAKQALQVIKEEVGTAHPRYLRTLRDLSGFYEWAGDYEQAELLHLESLEIRRANLGKEHPGYATGLNNLAVFYRTIGDYEKAESLCLEALEITKKSLGVRHHDYARVLSNLAWLYKAMGADDQAEPLFLEALEVRRTTLGETHPGYAAGLNSLARHYTSMGAYKKAEPLYVEALEITKTALGTKHPGYVTGLGNLARLYQSMHAYEKAEPLYLEALEAHRTTVGEKHPFHATHLHNLARLYTSMGVYEKAEPLYLEALEVGKATGGEEGSQYASILSSFAGHYTSTGSYEKAEQLYLEVLEMYKATLGEQAPSYAWNLHDLALLHRSRGAHEKAISFHEQAIDMVQASLEQAALALTEARQMAMARSRRGYVHDYLDTATLVDGAAPSAFGVVLNWKGVILVRQRLYRRIADQAEVLPVFEKLQQVTRRLATTSQKGPDKKDIGAWKEKLAELEAEKERLVREVASRSEAFRTSREKVTVDQFVEALPANSVLVDYAVLDLERWTPEEHSKLVAFVVRKDGSVSLHDLGEMGPIETAIIMWRGGNFGDSKMAKEGSATLRAAIWEPLLDRIGDAGLVLISPDGALGQLPFQALPGREAGSYLLEDHQLALLPVPQLLPTLLSDDDHTEPRTGLLAMGGVDYDADTEPVSPAEGPFKESLRRRRNVNLELRGGTFSNAIQANTLAEIALIEKLFADSHGEPVVTLEDAGATEEKFRNFAPGSYYIHLATHGFFAPADVRSSVRETVSPYLLSGLAFAGANQPPLADADDGILTAEEIAFLPLESAELVCLSACETGLGKLAGGEGLLGLQRAFQISGARSTIASLWKVPDLATRRLMERFYVNLWRHDMSKLDAFREAQLWLLHNPDQVLAESVKDGPNTQANDGRTPPIFWAAFQISGDWR